MLSTLLSGLATYFSKYFIVSSFLPTVTFAFLNAFATYIVHEPFRAWVDREVFVQATATRVAFLTTAVTVGLLIAAYVLSGLGNALRGILEGKWPERIRQLFIPLEDRRFRGFQRRLEEAARARVDLEASAPAWQEELLKARTEGTANHRGVNTFQGTEDVVDKVRALRALQEQHRLPSAKDLGAAIDALATHLRASDAGVTAGSGALLDQLHGELVQLITFAVELAVAEHFRHHNERHSAFGATSLEPTRMGNVSDTVQSYAVRRYNCNFELIWSQLQRSVQKEDKAYGGLQELKAQLDFLIACCWLTVASVATWIVVLARWGPSVTWFLMIALVGPVGAYLWYRAAAEHYRAFADLLMTLLDVFRFDVLKELRIALPADVIEERVLWDSLHQLSRYGEEMNFRYQHPKGP
jgi:hypothetical protein